jgi:hypothetical protein
MKLQHALFAGPAAAVAAVAMLLSAAGGSATTAEASAGLPTTWSSRWGRWSLALSAGSTRVARVRRPVPFVVDPVNAQHARA